MLMQTTTDTTSYVDVTAVLVQCDHDDEQGRNSEQTTLIRLQHSVFTGHKPTPEELETIKQLSKKLKITPIQAVPVRYTFRGQTRTSHTGCIMSEPLGPFYTAISVMYPSYGKEDCNLAWDKNPIEKASIGMIDAKVTAERLDSHRLRRTPDVTLQFDKGYPFSALLALMMALKLRNNRIEIRGVPMSPQELAVLKMRSGTKTIINGSK